MKIEYIFIHHTGATQDNPEADTSHHTLEIIDEYHKSLGWGSCGYNYVIEKDGRVRQGRKDNEIGAHTIGYNDRSIGICLSGNFDHYLPTEAQINALKELVKTKMTQYSIPLNKILPHRAVANKSCYGNLLSDDWIKNLLNLTPPQSEPCVSLRVELEEEKKKVSNLQAFIRGLLKFKK